MQNPNWWQMENNPLLRAPNFPPKMSAVILAGGRGEESRTVSKGGKWDDATAPLLCSCLGCAVKKMCF